MDIVKEEILLKLVKMIETKEVDVRNVIDVIKVTMKQVETIKGMPLADQKVLVIDLIRDLSRGADGIEGTEDDIIPVNVVAGAKAMIENSLVGSIFDMVRLADREAMKSGVSFLERLGCLRCLIPR